MSLKTFSAASVSVAIAIICGAAAIAVVRLVGWGIGSISADVGPASRLAFGLVAPFGVVLFALLVEKAGGIAERVTRMQPE